MRASGMPNSSLPSASSMRFSTFGISSPKAASRDRLPTASEALKAFPEIPREVIFGTSHWPQLDKPKEFDAILDRFLVLAEAGQKR